LIKQYSLFTIDIHGIIMLHLSSEVWAHVLSYIPEQSDLKTLRLVCPRFRDLAAKPLFHTIRVGLFPKYIKRLNAIAAHPYLRLCVRVIRFYGDLLSCLCLNYEDWYVWLDRELAAEDYGPAIWRAAYNKRELLDLDSFDQLEYLKCDQRFQKHMGKYHRRFTRLYYGQQRLLSQPFRTLVLLAAVNKFSGLQTVGIDAELSRLSEMHSRRTSGILGALESATLVDEAQLIHDDGPDTLTTLLFWLDSLAGVPFLRDLSCHAIPWRFWCNRNEFQVGATFDVSIVDVLSNIQKLSLTLSFAYLGDFRKDSALWRLWSFIQTPTQLDTLYLEFKSYYGKYNEIEPPSEWRDHHGLNGWCTDLTKITALLENLRLPHIRTLGLRHCEFSQAAFVRCMLSHASTLKEVYIGIIQLSQPSGTAGSWEAAIRTVAPEMGLEKVELHSLQDKEIEAYGPRNMVHPDNTRAILRQQHFLDGVASYLLQGGQVSWPSWFE